MVEEVVNIPVSLFESSKGRYFVGQSELLSFGNGKNAWSGLFNPCNSHVNLYVNVFTITNTSGTDFIAEIWLNSKFPGPETVSDMVTPANKAICPNPKPKVELIFAERVRGFPSRGVNAFDRMIPAKTTVAQEEDGKFIIPPGESFAIFLVGQEDVNIQGRVAFGWWEERC
ncbi:MAG: hypothetical protein H6Q73_2706 [Firmicutes bacterium]|nr:hypothetical protein [Bacillota bacterium]